jgi:Mg2+ and Co2+ transporter CorA
MQVIAGPRLAGGAAHPSKCHVLGEDGGVVVDFTRETVEDLLATDEFFWLDLYRPDVADFEILRDVFEFHPLAVQDSENFDQRAKTDDYEDFVSSLSTARRRTGTGSSRSIASTPRVSS